MKTKLCFLSLTILLSFWSANAQVTVSGSISGNGSYTTLGDAIAAIPLTGQSGNNITIEIGASTIEVSTGITIGAGNWSTLKIYPTASDIIVSAAANTSTSPFIILSGANNVTIDGRLNQTGASSLTIDNVSTAGTNGTTAGSTIMFDNSAQNNTVKYCTIKGRQAGAFGIISFSANATLTNGNGLNVIDNNVITNNGGPVLYGLYAIGNITNPNVGNQITNNQFKDILNNTLATNVLFIVGGPTADAKPQNDNYTISGNSFFNASGLGSVTAGGTRQFIAIGSGTNTYGGSHTITGNFFGGTAPNCGGTMMTKWNTSSNLTCIYISTSPSTVGGGATSIQNNTIQKISWQNGTNANFNGISVAGTGNVNIGTVTGNTIGDNTTTGSIVISNFSTTAPNNNGILITTTVTTDCQNNKIGSITVWNGNTTTATSAPFFGIQKSATAGITTISNNIIGSTTIANSIYAYRYISSTVQTNPVAQHIYPIYFQGTGTGTISNNTIANITNFTTIGNLAAIYLNGAGSTTTVNGNLIHSNKITGFTTGGTNALSGILSTQGINTITNNIVRLGDDNAAIVRGIIDNTTTTTGAKIYHNTIYISGTPTTDAFTSACIFNNYNAAQTAKDYRNNILVNARSRSGATDEHYSFHISSNTATGLTTNGNNYFVTGTGGYNLKIGTGAGSNGIVTFTGQDAASMSIDPSFANAGGTNASDYIPLSKSLKGVSSTGVTTDYYGSPRFHPTIGAHEVLGTKALSIANNSTVEILQPGVGQILLKGIEVETGKVYSLQGKLVKSFTTNTFIIDNAQKGIYILSVTDKSGTVYNNKFTL